MDHVDELRKEVSRLGATHDEYLPIKAGLLRDVIAERDALLVALEKIVNDTELRHRDIARAAIAAAREGTDA